MTVRATARLAWPVLSVVWVCLPPGARAAQVAPATPGWLSISVPDARPEPTPENIAEGKRLYNLRCSPCHGVKGDGEGPVARFLDPRPRDFTLALFKIRTTVFGELPVDEDMFRTITRGVPGTAMPSWKPLPVDERWKLIDYIKTFSDFFVDEEADPHRTDEDGTYIIEIPEPPPLTPEILEAGEEAFERGKCVECHGTGALGNGTSAGKQNTARRFRVLPRNLTKGWRFKGGTGVRDIWKTLTAGMNGTPMPSFIESFDQDDPVKDVADRWAVAYYVRSLITEPDDEPETVLRVRRIDRVDGQVPIDPNDEAWDAAEEITFRMFGQVTRRPRWQIPAVDSMRVRALYDDDAIAIRLEYHDRTKSTEHLDPDILDEETTYPELDVTKYEDTIHVFRDAVALQFPKKPTIGATRPYFLYGQSERPVVLWRYLADADTVLEADAKGADKIASREPGDEPVLTGQAQYDNGIWRVVFKRPRTPAEPEADVDFVPGRYIPFSVMAWDGGNGESGLRQSLSSWYSMRLDAPIPKTAWAFGFSTVIGVGLIELLLLRRARRRT